MSLFDFDNLSIAQYLTGMAKEAYQQIEAQQVAENSLSQYFPDRFVDTIQLSTGDLRTTRPVMAFNRAWDAEPARGTLPPVKTVRFENIPLTQKYTTSEKDTLMSYNQGAEALEHRVQDLVVQGVQAIADRLEYQRGQTLSKAKFLAEVETGTLSEDDWGRSAEAAPVVANKFNAESTKILDELVKLREAYRKLNGFYPGTLIVSPKVFLAIQTNPQFATKMLEGYRPATLDDVNSVLAGQRLPSITVYDRQVQTYDGPVDVLDNDSIYLLPPAGSPILGETVFSRTTTARELGWNGVEGQGIVANAIRRNNVAALRDVVVDSIAMPALYSPNAAFKAQVL